MSETRSVLIPSAAVFLITLAVFAGVKDFQFTLDSPRFLRDDPRIRDARFGEIFTTDYWNLGRDRTLVSELPSLYRPVALAWLAIGLQLTSRQDLQAERSPPINVGNLLWHALASAARCALLILLLSGCRGRMGTAFLVSLGLALHPVTSETIGTQVGASEGLGALFSTLALLSALQRGRLAWVAQAVATYLAILSKENAVVLPAMVGLTLWLGRGRSFRDAVQGALPAAVATGLALLQRYWVLGSLTGISDPVMAGFPLLARIATGAAVFLTHTLPSVFWPTRLNPNWTLGDIAPAASFLDGRAAGGAVAIVLLAFSIAWTWRRRPRFALGLLLFTLPWLPVSHLLVPIGAVSATRFVYLPLFGLGLALSDLLTMPVAPGSRMPWVLRGSLMALVVALAVLGKSEVERWKSDLVLLETGVARHGNSAFLNYNLGTRLAEAGARDPRHAAGLVRARDHFQAASEMPIPEIPGRMGIVPEDLLELRFQAASNLGIAEMRRSLEPGAGTSERRSLLATATLAFARATATADQGLAQARALGARTHWEALTADARVGEARFLIVASALLQPGGTEERRRAVGLLQEVERSDPKSVGLALARAALLTQDRDVPEAVRVLQEALAANRDRFERESRVREVAMELARLLESRGEKTEAAGLKLEAVLADPPPHHPRLLLDLGTALLNVRDEKLRALARRALEEWLLDPEPKDPIKKAEVKRQLAAAR